MNKGKIKNFFNMYPNEIKIYSIIIIFHMLRKTLLNTANEIGGAASLTGGTSLILICIALSLYIIYKEQTSLPKATKSTITFIWYYLFAIISFLWSDIDNAFNTVVPKATEVLVSFCALSVVFWKIKGRYQAMVFLLFLTTCATFLGYANYIKMTGSLIAHTNTYSLMGAIGALLGLSMKRYYNIKHLNLIIAFNLWAIFAGTSSATYISFITGYLLLRSTNKKGINIGKALLIIGLATFVYHYGMDLIYDYIFTGRSQEKIENMSGRTIIWEACFNAWETSPWLGIGFIVGERNLIEFGSHINALSAHNGYLSILVNTGVVGCMIFGLFLLKTILKAWRYLTNRFYGKEMTSLFIVLACVMVNNMAYPAFGSDWNFTLVPIMGIFILIHTLNYKIK